MNIGQRLEDRGKQVALDAEVCVSIGVNAHAAVGANFAVEGLGVFVLRGRETPLEIYRLLLSQGDGER